MVSNRVAKGPRAATKAARGTMVVVSGPSGAGKGTLCEAVVSNLDSLKFSVSATTRPPRRNEVEGIHYCFISDDDFEAAVEAEEFLEWATYCGNRYGTLKKHVNDLLDKGYDVLLDLDTQGAHSIRKLVGDDAIFVFIVPPSFDQLRARIDKRGTEKPQDVKMRMVIAERELSQMRHYDYIIVNDVLEEAISDLTAILRAEGLRRNRVGEVWFRRYLRQG